MTHDQIIAACWAVAIFLVGLSLLAVSKWMERRANWRRMALLELRITAERNQARRFDEAWADIVAHYEAQDSNDEPTIELDGLPFRAGQIDIPREGKAEQ